MASLNIYELEKAQESENLSSFTREVIDILLLAINDWPTEVISLEEYESEVRAFIGGETTKSKINKALSRIDYSTESWMAESLSQLIEVFELYNKNVSLKEFIRELEIKFEEEKLV